MKKEDVLAKIKAKEFCNLHGHSTYSMGDAIGHANEIVDSVIENHMNSVAISDHGNMNVIGDFYKYSQKINKKGIDFKPIFANEFYFIPSLDEWQVHRDFKKGNISSSEAMSLSEKVAEFATTYTENHFEDEEEKNKKKIKSTAALEVTDEDDESSVVEDENESKFSKDFSPIKRRHHLVLMAMNEEGLANLLRLNGEAQENGFYMKPRIDFKLIEKYNKGIVCTSACLAGILSYELRKGKALGQSEEQILITFENIVDRFDQIFNADKSMPSRFYLEIQFNKLEIQHELNEYIVKLHRRTGIPLVAAADYHYPKRELFRARDLIKWVAHSRKYSDLTVRESVDELECELFPKNAHEMVEAYFDYDGKDYITEEELLSSIRNAKFIADELIEKFEIDTSPKLPKIGVGNTQKALENLIIDRFGKYIKAGKIPKEKAAEYMKRIEYELSIIKKKRFADYFLTYEIIMGAIKEEMLISPGRGSGPGSLINWLLGITDIDPIRFNLKFERFLDEHRTQVYPKMDSF